MVELIALLIAAAEPAAVEVYTADLARVVLATERGRAIAKELGRLERKEQAAIRAKEDRLAIRRSSMPPDAYAAAVDALAKRTEAAEAELLKKQDELLAPELAELRTRMKTAAPDGVKIVSVLDAPLIGAPEVCDATGWLEKPGTKLKRSAACRFERFYYVRFDDVLAQLDEAARVKARLDAARERYQKDLDASQKELAKLRGAPGGRKKYVAHAARVERKFAALQRRLEADERREQERLYARIENTVRSLARRSKDVAWVERIDGAPRLEPSCDASTWVAEVLDGKAKPSDWRNACKP